MDAFTLGNMFRARSMSRIWTTWLTAWVLLLGALAPTLSHALMAQGPANQGFWGAAICSSSGTKDSTSPSSPDTPSGTSAFGAHCPFCLPHDGSMGLPPLDLTGSIPQMVEADSVPFLFLHAPQPLFAWGGAQPRAPPAELI